MREEIEGIIMDMAAIKERMTGNKYPSKIVAEYNKLKRKLKRLWKLQHEHRVLAAQIAAEITHTHSPSVEPEVFHEPVDPLDRDVDNSTLDVRP